MKRKSITHNLHPFNRLGVRIDESIWVDGEVYFSARSIAEWLRLSKKDDAVQKIVRRNPYIKEFSREIEVIIEEPIQKNVKPSPPSLGGQCPLSNAKNRAIIKELCKNESGKGETFSCETDCPNAPAPKTRRRKINMRVFSAVGLQLIAMESHSKKAIQYKIAAAKLLNAIYQGKIRELNSEQHGHEAILAQVLQAPLRRRVPLLMKYADAAGVSRATAYKHLGLFKKGESPTDKKHCNPRPKRVIEGDLELEIRGIFFRDPDQPIKNIWRVLGSPKSPSYAAVKTFVNKLKREYRAGQASAEPVQ